MYIDNSHKHVVIESYSTAAEPTESHESRPTFTMFASRANQENAVYQQQTAAAAKPLNQTTNKPLAPKTPAHKGTKTPFRARLNDENLAFAGGKTGGKGKEPGLGEGKSTTLDTSAFVTPAGPRNRAPLGNKTTNAKATAFQTPALLPAPQDKQSAKHTSPRLRRAKIKVHDAEPAAAESDDDLPEIEYMPPREVPLPDHPDHWPHDRTYPQFEGRNLTRGWWSENAGLKDDDDDTDFSDFGDELQKEQALRASRGKKTPVKEGVLQKTNTHPLSVKLPATLNSKRAAAALSHPAQSTNTPRFAAPTAASKTRAPAAMVTSKKVPSGEPTANGNSRHGAARVASNNTLGYCKGRAVSSSARKPMFDVYDRQEAVVPEKMASPAKPSLAELFGVMDFLEDANDGDDDELGGGVALDHVELDAALEDFQLEPVEM